MKKLMTTAAVLVALIAPAMAQAPIMSQQMLGRSIRENNTQPSTPAQTLFVAYHYYILAKACNETRRGYLIQYVNDVELERAEIAIRAISKQSIESDTSLNTDQVWASAQQAAQGAPLMNVMCQNYLSRLIRLSPVSTYTINKPEAKR